MLYHVRQPRSLGSAKAPTNTGNLGYRASTDQPRSNPKSAGKGKRRPASHLDHIIW